MKQILLLVVIAIGTAAGCSIDSAITETIEKKIGSDDEVLEVLGRWDTGFGDMVVTSSKVSWYDTDDKLSYEY